MIIEFFLKLCCRHKWKSHAKVEREWTQVEQISLTSPFPQVHEVGYSETTEVLICEKCGKIRTITY